MKPQACQRYLVARQRLCGDGLVGRKRMTQACFWMMGQIAAERMDTMLRPGVCYRARRCQERGP